ncbi:putative gustatory receptor 39b [Ceratitis capitata]|uniref:putative gustatory receptor 39b n=1 Tax=Ceratitis capitata TaxID=7213 RepID=UPI000329CC79|nr:putative gustatory receptor 39b [Ceratitis capitata]
MEQQLQAWLRYCVYFGIYVNATPSTERVSSTELCWATKQLYRKRNFYHPRAYIYFLACITCIAFALSLVWHTYPPDLQLNWIATCILFISRYVTNSLILLEALRKRREHDEFLKLLVEIEASLRIRLHWQVESRQLLAQIKGFLKFQLVLSFLGLLPFMVFSLIVVEYGGYFWQGLWFICTARLRTLQLLVYLRILRHYLRGLCLKLRQIMEFHMAPSCRLLDIDYGRLGTLKCLLAVKETYTLIHEAIQLLNYFAGLSLWGIIISCVLDLSSNFYWVLQSFDNFHGRRYYYLIDLWWFVPVTVLVWELCYVCDDCMRLLNVAYFQGCTLTQLLSKIIVSSTSGIGRNYRIVLQQFSMQMQLQRIEVSACNFFKLDMRFVMSICTAMAMHLVILIQF